MYQGLQYLVPFIHKIVDLTQVFFLQKLIQYFFLVIVNLFTTTISVRLHSQSFPITFPQPQPLWQELFYISVNTRQWFVFYFFFLDMLFDLYGAMDWQNPPFLAYFFDQSFLCLSVMIPLSARPFLSPIPSESPLLKKAKNRVK